MTPGDLDILTRTLYGEARGESDLGRRAVAHVILNRAKLGFTIAQVCLKPFQFSAWNPNDPNYKKLQAVGLDDKDFRGCMRAALTAIDEPDLVSGARHYCTVDIDPPWAKGHQPVCRIGGHKFFAGIK